VLDLVGFLFYDFAATALQDKRSCLNERMGKQLFGQNISISDDVYHPLQQGSPFDGEGMPRQRVLLVDRGIPTNLVYSRAAAKARANSPPGTVLPCRMNTGKRHESRLRRRRFVDRGNGRLHCSRVACNRLWYIREVDPYEKVMTGMTRDGLFLVDNGRVSGAVRNFRFNQSIIEMLKNVELLGPAVRATGEEAFEMVVPAMKVRDFQFSEVTSSKRFEPSGPHLSRNQFRESKFLRCTSTPTRLITGMYHSDGRGQSGHQDARPRSTRVVTPTGATQTMTRAVQASSPASVVPPATTLSSLL